MGAHPKHDGERASVGFNLQRKEKETKEEI